MTKEYGSLRAAQIARNTEWTLGQGIEDYTWRAAELAGEVGEVCDLLGPGSWERRDALAEELADSVICIDLVRGMFSSLHQLHVFTQGPYHTDAMEARWALSRPVLVLCNVLKKLERDRRGWPGSRAGVGEVEHHTYYLMGKLGAIADYHHINLALATVIKFNLTSIKVGLETRLTYANPYSSAVPPSVPVAMAAALL